MLKLISLSFSKDKSLNSILSFMLKTIKPYKWYYLLILLAPICGAFYKPIVLYSMKLMIDIITKPNGFIIKELVKPIMIYLFADLTLTFLWRMSNIATWKSEPFVKRNILLLGVSTVLSFSYNFFLNTSSGSITSKLKGLLEGYSNIWGQMYFGVLFWAIACLTTCSSIFLINPYLGLIVTTYASIFIIINFFLAKKIDKLSFQENQAKHDAIGKISDIITNFQSIKYFSSRINEYNRLKIDLETNYIPKEQKSIKMFFKISLFNDFLGINVFIIMLVIMIKLKQHNVITTGDFAFVFGIVLQFQENLWLLMNEYNNFVKYSGDLKSSLTILNNENNDYLDESKKFILNTAPKIVFKNINFIYDNNTQIFNNLNLIISPNEKIGIVGFTGAGKSTLINLLLKNFTLQKGQILINDIDIKHINNDTLRSNIALIPQDITLFHRTLLENIRYGNLTASDDEVIVASKKAHVHEFVSQLPNGYQTLVGERGIKLSGGQRQRIAIARALLKNASILILDEATSSLDSITEQYIQDSIKQLITGKTVIAIAHRLSTLKDMDRLIVIDKGQIIETGTHDQLLNTQNSLYAKIWLTQFNDH